MRERRERERREMILFLSLSPEFQRAQLFRQALPPCSSLRCLRLRREAQPRLPPWFSMSTKIEDATAGGGWATAIAHPTGVSSVQLAQASDNFPHIPYTAEAISPGFNGDYDEFRAQVLARTPELDQLLQMQTKNRVKRCPQCNKPNAFTLSHCNACGYNLTAVEISFTNNIFTGFIYGIARGPFPFTISLRSQTPEVMVFDDLLALSPCHLNTIPCNCYIPDVRTLFSQPKAGLQLVQTLFDAAWGVASEQFIGNAAWRAKMYAGDVTPESLRPHVIAGFNFPPSQYQLHLQFMLPPLTPFHHRL